MLTTSLGMQFVLRFAQKYSVSVIVPTIMVPVSHRARAAEKYSFGALLPMEMFTPVSSNA